MPKSESKPWEQLPLQLILSEEQLTAIGHVAVQWAFLESEIAQHTDLTARTHNLPVPKEINFTSFAKRIEAWRTLAQQINTEAAARKAVLMVIDRISSIQDQRHRTIHARWGLSKSGQLIAFSDRGRNVFEWKTSAAKLWKIVHQISQLNVDLGNLPVPPLVAASPSQRKRRKSNPQ